MVEVKVYSTPTCPYCNMAKDFLKENNIEFKEYDVSEDTEARNEMLEKSGQMGVPVILIDEEAIIGFNKEAIKNALGI
ncbi:MAG: Uxx-star family glutaredoxin-like (seleno)protein [Nanoarchaeota archaeon]|nr:Uxx-star family glutaredoxin-like (seleno)protein [Nanoarchaeota archaeon]